MKIQNEARRNIGFNNLDRDAKLTGHTPKNLFGDEFKRVQVTHVRQELEKLLKEISFQGEKLFSTMTVKELKKYKSLVKDFLAQVSEKMYLLREETAWDRRGRHKVMFSVEKVNRELEGLTELLLQEQKDQVAILAKIDEIKGLLLDLYS